MTIDTSTMHFDDVIDVRVIIERIEELEGERENLQTDYNHLASTDYATDLERTAAFEALTQWDKENAEELQTLQDLMQDLKGNGGDEQWDGDWYPVTLIRESYFEEYMDEMVADCYEVPKNLPSFMTITLDYVALQMDYTSTEINGITYFFR